MHEQPQPPPWLGPQEGGRLGSCKVGNMATDELSRPSETSVPSVVRDGMAGP